jgi:hypothetical protein
MDHRSTGCKGVILTTEAHDHIQSGVILTMVLNSGGW